MPQSRTNLNPEPKTNSPYLVGLLLRYSTFGAAILIFLAGLLLLNWWLIILGGFGVCLGIYDVIQSKHAILKKKNVLFRIPIIPGYNDSLKDAENFSRLLKLYNINKVELLPFHQFGKSKYKFLNRKYEFENTKQIYAEDLKEYKEVILRNKIECSIS